MLSPISACTFLAALVAARATSRRQPLPKPSLASPACRTPGRLLSANLGKPQSRLTACQGTADALTGLLPRAPPAGAEPSHVAGHRPWESLHRELGTEKTAHVGQRDPDQRVSSSITSSFSCQGLRTVPRAWGRRSDAWIMQSCLPWHPLTPWGKPSCSPEWLCSAQG